jgi:hypothetical protein
MGITPWRICYCYHFHTGLVDRHGSPTLDEGRSCNKRVALAMVDLNQLLKEVTIQLSA